MHHVKRKDCEKLNTKHYVGAYVLHDIHPIKMMHTYIIQNKKFAKSLK